jgi:hypothetical protein
MVKQRRMRGATFYPGGTGAIFLWVTRPELEAAYYQHFLQNGDFSCIPFVENNCKAYH